MPQVIDAWVNTACCSAQGRQLPKVQYHCDTSTHMQIWHIASASLEGSIPGQRSCLNLNNMRHGSNLAMSGMSCNPPLGGLGPHLRFRHMLCRQQQICVAGARFVYPDARYRNKAAVCIAGASAARDPIRPVLHPGPGRPSESQDEQQAQVPPILFLALVLLSSVVVYGRWEGASLINPGSAEWQCSLSPDARKYHCLTQRIERPDWQGIVWHVQEV